MEKRSLDYELNELTNFQIIAGIDEAGRGCCAGPLVCACVILPKNYTSVFIQDSKKLNANQRIKAFDLIKKDALEITIEIIPAAMVDKLNPKAASKLGMKLCFEKLKNKVDLVITDFEKIDIDAKQINLVKGDAKSINVAAASIIAKVTRDQIMEELDKKYPLYNFQKRKGYCTKEHNNLISKYGICPEHRKTYKNVLNAIKQ